jgi:Fe(3+) dicitrate transport protein
LDGEGDLLGLSFKHNNRRYLSEGIQTNLDWEWREHRVAVGGRYHEDEVDRFQPTERYNQIDGELILDHIVDPKASDNRLQTAEALAFWVTDAWQVTEALRLDVAIRHERVDTRERRFSDTARNDLASESANDISIWLPGLAALYQINDQWSLLAGVHRGFSPLGGGAKSWEKPETSVNYEFGVRYEGEVFAEVIGFYSDFANKGESCSNAYPCSNGATSGTFITGEALVAGIEAQVGTVFETGAVTWPLSLAYTFSRAEARGEPVSEGIEHGDTLASVPEHTFSLRLGAEIGARWDSYAVVKYTDSMCVEIGCNRDSSPYAETEGFLSVDVGARYAVTDRLSAFAKLENALDKRAIVSRQPDGARPNKPMTALVGVEWIF